jgi:hypothetical protein
VSNKNLATGKNLHPENTSGLRPEITSGLRPEITSGLRPEITSGLRRVSQAFEQGLDEYHQAFLAHNAAEGSRTEACQRLRLNKHNTFGTKLTYFFGHDRKT